jgi:hypothetical protein
MGGTFDELLNHLVLIVAVLGVLYLLRVVFLAREGIRLALKRVIFGGLLMFVVQQTAPSFGLKAGDAEIVAAITGVFGALVIPNRSRRIPARVRKRVIERHLKSGGEYDPKQHDIDHVVPFSRGGSHSEENLRVLPKKDNRRKGAKMPRFRDLW